MTMHYSLTLFRKNDIILLVKEMKMLNTNEISIKWNISERRIRKLCENNLINGAIKENGFWKIPENSNKPQDRRYKSRKRVVVVTNSSFVGEVITKAFISIGYKVSLICEEKLSINEVQCFKCNINDYNKLKNIFENIDRIDSLIAFPSSYLPKTILNTTVEDFNYYSNLIIKHTYNAIKYSLDKIRKSKGSITIIHSSVALNPEPGATIYSMLQASLVMLGKALAIREGGFGVRVNNIALGPARTDKLMEKVTKTQIKEWKDINPLGVSFKFDDCLDPLVNLVNKKGGFAKMTGTVIPIDGGESIADAYTSTQKGGAM